MTSPTPALILSERPMTRMHWIVRAPVLSATLRRDCGWVIRGHPQRGPRPTGPRPRLVAVVGGVAATRVRRGVDRLGRLRLLRHDVARKAVVAGTLDDLD